VVRGAVKLVDRRAERSMLDRLVEAVCAGQSRALVLCGEPGVGKTALLQYLIRRALKMSMRAALSVRTNYGSWCAY
jgi:DNA replication protein DnaC